MIVIRKCLHIHIHGGVAESQLDWSWEAGRHFRPILWELKLFFFPLSFNFYQMYLYWIFETKCSPSAHHIAWLQFLLTSLSTRKYWSIWLHNFPWAYISLQCITLPAPLAVCLWGGGSADKTIQLTLCSTSWNDYDLDEREPSWM